MEKEEKKRAVPQGYPRLQGCFPGSSELGTGVRGKGSRRLFRKINPL